MNRPWVSLLAVVEIGLGIAGLTYGIWYFFQAGGGEGAEIARAGAKGFAVLGLALLLAGLALRARNPLKWLAQLLWLVPVVLIAKDLSG